MSFLRLGTSCVVLDEAGQVLLSQRGDLGTWGLPGGRLDRGERLEDAALREVREETGIIAEIVRAAGLIYRSRWQRLNVLYLARAAGGTLLGRTHETRDNRFFALGSFPSGMQHEERVRSVLNGDTVLTVVDTSPQDYRRLRRKFALRWVENLLRGRPEPRYPRFNIRATCVMKNDRLVSIPCDGADAPWQALTTHAGISTSLRWIGVGEDASDGVIDFVFAADSAVEAIKSIPIANHHEYMRLARQDGPVWSIPFSHKENKNHE